MRVMCSHSGRLTPRGSQTSILSNGELNSRALQEKSSIATVRTKRDLEDVPSTGHVCLACILVSLRGLK